MCAQLRTLHGRRSEIVSAGDLEQYEQRIEKLRARWELQADAVLQQLGYPAGYGKRLVGDVDSLLRQAAAVFVRITQDEQSQKLTIQFDKAGEKRVVDSFVERL